MGFARGEAPALKGFAGDAVDAAGAAAGQRTRQQSMPPEIKIGTWLLVDAAGDPWEKGGDTARARTSCECSRFVPVTVHLAGVVPPPIRVSWHVFWSTPAE